MIQTLKYKILFILARIWKRRHDFKFWRCFLNTKIFHLACSNHLWRARLYFSIKFLLWNISIYFLTDCNRIVYIHVDLFLCSDFVKILYWSHWHFNCLLSIFLAYFIIEIMNYHFLFLHGTARPHLYWFGNNH